MKTILKLTVILVIFAGCFSCDKDEMFYYYYFGEKISLKVIENKMLVKFVQGSDVNQIMSLVKNDKLLKFSDDVDVSIYKEQLLFAILKTKNGRKIPQNVFERSQNFRLW